MKNNLSWIVVGVILCTMLISGCLCCCNSPENSKDTSNVVTTKASGPTTTRQKPEIDLTYNYKLEPRSDYDEGRVKVTGTMKNKGQKPAYKVNVECKAYDEYNVKLGSGSLCILGCDFNLYPGDEKDFEVSMLSDNIEHTAKVVCESKFSETA